MKRNVLLVVMIGLLMTGCGSNSPSSPEEVLKKGIEALHNKNFDDVNLYFNLSDWEAVQGCKAALVDERLYRMPDRLLKIVKTEEGGKYTGVQSVFITAIVVNRGGEEVEDEFVLYKTPSGRWKIHPTCIAYWI